MKTMVCSVCGSEDIKVNSWVVWNKATQQYEIDNLWEEESWCESCQETVLAEEREEE